MKTDLDGIKNIIFDLGKVLLNLDFDASIKAFQKLGVEGDILDHKNAYADPVFYRLEIGEVTPEQFCAGVRRILNNETITDEQIENAWYAMIKDIPAHRVQLLQNLKKKYRLFLFSNTNKIHIDRLLVEFKLAHGIDFHSLFETVFYSHEIHDRKPEVSSYKKVIELAGIDPDETLFIDDLEKNIIGAQNAGLKTFWLKDGKELTEVIRLLQDPDLF